MSSRRLSNRSLRRYAASTRSLLTCANASSQISRGASEHSAALSAGNLPYPVNRLFLRVENAARTIMAADHRPLAVGPRPFEAGGGPPQDRPRHRAW